MNQPWGMPPQQPSPGGYGQQGQPQWAGQSAAGQGQLVVDIKHHPLAWIYRFFSPVITLNGQRLPGRWGPNALALPPGHHQLFIHLPYLLPPEVGRAGATVPVQPGQQLHLEYRAPMIVFMAGALGPAPQKWPGVIFTYAVFGVLFLFLALSMIALILAAVASG
ncbi:hypothetical protein [Actinomadura sp. 7K507]|uniref:hypothetical protein n=1 Tax=Actinomadura sp. 7K507 TaxID=2530365 RepID=UPI00104C6ABD|nr:hypothetical protein [Actinomadura sp. 7K507]TDC89919.1 hypothetical protein E1285_15580 [Actinomadura sp. 7K507]